MSILKSRVFFGASPIALALCLVPVSSIASAQEADPTAPAAAASNAVPSQETLPGSSSISDASPSPSAEGAPAEEIIVTGSRLGRTSFNSPTPVNVVGQRRLQQLAIPTVADALNQLPSFRATTTPTSVLFRASGAIGANTVDLRGLGTTRTLVLLDGRRFVPSTEGGAVDLNAIPSALVQRTETVTGGASAAYGADAVAGVVNLILDTKFDGFKVNANAGISGHGDAENYFVSAAFGSGFADGRGHVIVGAEYTKNYGVGTCYTRDYCRRYVNYVNNPGYIGGRSTNGLPATLVLNDVRFAENDTGFLASVVAGGVNFGQQLNSPAQLPAALRGLQFNAAGNGLVPFQVGNLLSGQFVQGGDPSTAVQLYGFGNGALQVATSHFSGMVHTDYELTDTTSVFAEFLYSNVRGGPAVGSVVNQAPLALNINNPFITPAVRAQILAALPNATTVNVNVARPESGDQTVATSDNDTWRIAAGIRGEIFGSFRWDAAYTHGETKSYVNIGRSRLRTLEGEAAQAITPPAGYTGTIYRTPAGAPVICASSVANPANGCLPVNFLGQNAFTQQVLDKYFVTGFQTRKIKLDTFAANLRGPLFELWAGPLDAAIGGEYRVDSTVGNADAFATQGLLAAPSVTALPFSRRKVIEGYIEASLPLLKDSPLGKSLVVDGALRRTHYNTFGNATTWKVGLVYSPTSDLLARVTKSRDIRAPTAAETNPNATSTNLPLNDPFGGGTHFVTNVTGGNPNLQLENADTFTAGLVLTPTFVPGLRISTDYYNISVKNGIDSLSAPTILQACAQQNLVCDLIQFSGAPRASQAATVFSNFQNLSRIKARGLEFVAEYRIPDVVGGNIDIAVNANYVMKLRSIGATGLVTRLEGVTGNAGSLTSVLGVPDYKIDALITYSRESWSITAHGRYIPKSTLDPTKIGPDDPAYNINLPNSANINTVSAAFYMDLSGSIKTGLNLFGSNGVELYGAVNNLFDKYPPKELRFFGNPLHYDVVGRSFRVGFRSNF